MMEIGMHEAKTRLSQLVEQALHGGEVIITRRGKPVVRLAPVRPTTGALSLMGAWRGQVQMADDFDELPDDIAASFNGE
jgi:prevent-host-death family protein